jgi:GTP-binding protein TypA/BipA
VEAIPFQKISEPTIAMHFIVNDSPLAGRDGKFITSRHLRDRLFKELNTDVSLRVEETETTESFKVSGRGELHLSVLIENMRREGFEFAVSKAEVLYHTDENGKKLEPMELAYIDVPNEFAGAVIEKLGQRKGELRNMGSISGGTYTRLEFSIPARGLIGYRGEFMTDTKGNGILNTVFDDYGPYKGVFHTKDLSAQIGSARLSFAKPEYMEKFLDITPGSVSVLGLMNDKEHQVKLLIDEEVLDSEYFGCHPCINTSSLRMRTADLIEKVLPAMEHDFVKVKL